MPFGAAFGCLLGAGKTSPASAAGAVRTIPQRQLYISEPNPVYFGNRPNPQLGEPGWTNRNWLKSRFHFNFAEYDEGSDSFGVLRVMNDDLVQPKRGFGMHPHRDVEIITLIIHGQLTHRDSMGTEETLGRGGVQYMTAGTGIQHSEHNLQNEALRFVQCWVVPRRRGLRPKYGSMAGTKENEALRQNQWAHIVCDAEGSQKAPVRIYQDCNVFLSELSPGASLPKMELQAGRQGYLLCVEGSVQLTDADGKVQRLQQHDAAELTGPLCLQPKAEKAAMLLLFEMEQTHRGY